MSEELKKRPGGSIPSRPLHFIWIVDCSGSMSGERIHALNYAVREAITVIREAAKDHPECYVLMSTIKFSNGAEWVSAQPTSVDSYKWTDLRTDGVADMGKALEMVAEQLKMPPMDARGLPPVLVLFSSIGPTDDFTAGLKALMDQPWGQKAIRVAIAIGGNADLIPLQKFIGHAERKPLQANNLDAVVKAIKWSSTVVRKTSASRPSSGSSSSSVSDVPIPDPPVLDDGDDVW